MLHPNHLLSPAVGWSLLQLSATTILLLAPASWLYAAQLPVDTSAASGSVTVITSATNLGEIAGVLEATQAKPAANNNVIRAAIIDLTTNISDILLLEAPPSSAQSQASQDYADRQGQICLGSALIVGGLAGGGELTESFILSWLMHTRKFRFLAPNKAWAAAAIINSLLTLTRWSVVTGGGCYGLLELHHLISHHRGNAKADR